MGKNKKLQFQTKKSVEAAKAKRFVIAFFSFIIVFGTISMLVLLKSYNYDLSNMFNERRDETESSASTKPAAAVFTGSANILVFCLADDGKELRFIAVVHADLGTKSFKVCSLSPKVRAAVQNSNTTLAGHWHAGGVRKLIQAVEAFGDITINRYISSTDTGFKNCINDLGGLELNITENINVHNGDLALSLVKGRQTLKGDMLLRYIRYNGTRGDAGIDAQSQTVCSMLDQYINEYNAAKGEALFGSLINYINSGLSGTDITIFDYASCKPAIDMLAASADRPPAKVEQYLHGFEIPGTQATEEVSVP